MPGVGTGPELAEVMFEVLECAGAPLRYEVLHPERNEEEYNYTLQSIKRNGVAIKGNIEPKSSTELFLAQPKNMRIKKDMDLFVDVIECKSFPGIENRMRVHKQLDIVVMRQNTEGEYALLEHEPVRNVLENVQIITYYNTKRVCEYAFNYAIANNRCKVTLLHNQHVNPMTENLMREAFDEVANKYPDILGEKHTVNHGLKMLLKNKNAWDIVITNSVFGSMLVSILFGMIGSARLVAEANVGERYMIFEPAYRGRGLDIAGKDIVNPTGFIMSGVLALEGLGHKKPAEYIRQALNELYIEGKTLTIDLGGKATTREFVRNLVQKLRNLAKLVHCKYDPIPKIPPTPPKPEPYDPKKDKLFTPPKV
ncbi:isocitrate dehydrogenase [NAD] subunit gamma, mitochondrial-like isoform X2 [Rhodnius prolixus]